MVSSHLKHYLLPETISYFSLNEPELFGVRPENSTAHYQLMSLYLRFT